MIQTPDVFYNVYFLFIVSIMLMLIPLIFYADFENKYARPYDNLLCVYIILGAVTLLGLRGWDVGTDTPAYLRSFHEMQTKSSIESTLQGHVISRDPVFNVFTYLTTKITNDRGYLITIAILYLLPIVITANRIGKINKSVLLFGFVCLLNFTSLGINILRQGISLSFLVLATTYVTRLSFKNTILFIVCSTLAISFHFSALIAVLFMILVLFVKSNWIYFATFFVCTVMAYLKLGLINFPVIGPLLELNERISTYATGEASQVPSGLQLSNLTFHLSVIGWSVYNNTLFHDKYYGIISRLFLALSCFFFLCLNISFSDRFGVLSWILVPILIAYPLLNYRGITKYQMITLIGMFLVLGIYTFYRLA